MALTTFATIQRGETFQYTLSGRQAGDTITARLKPAASGLGVPESSVAAVATFTTVTSDDVDGAGTDGWILTLDATSTAGLAVGNYVFDERIVNAAGQIENTEASILRIVERVTAP